MGEWLSLFSLSVEDCAIPQASGRKATRKQEGGVLGHAGLPENRQNDHILIRQYPRAADFAGLQSAQLYCGYRRFLLNAAAASTAASNTGPPAPVMGTPAATLNSTGADSGASPLVSLISMLFSFLCVRRHYPVSLGSNQGDRP